MKNSLQKAIELYIESPHDPRTNFIIGYEYDKRGQIAAALSFYLRTAEMTASKELQYECLLRNFLNLAKQPNRDSSATGQLFHAISLLPRRPEAHFLLSRYYESKQKWQESYTAACLGIELSEKENSKLVSDVEYPGEYALFFQKAVAGWWIGKCDEARELFRWIMDTYSMNEVFTTASRNNLIRIKGNIFPITTYTKEKYPELLYKFSGAHIIEKNYSQTYQDMFVLSMLNGKKNGTYLEIGAGNPFHNSNTALLETKFQWKGISIELDQKEVDNFKAARKNNIYCQDATQTDYKTLLQQENLPADIDYLQLDCDPPEVTYAIMESIPFDLYRFAVITYEHDHYTDSTSTFREKSRKYLQELGYVMVVGDISADKNSSYEDWWVHPELVDVSILSQMQNSGTETKKAEDYMLGKL